MKKLSAKSLSRRILSLERKLVDVGDKRERDLLVLYLNSLRSLKEALKVFRLYRFFFGKKEAESLPPPLPEEEVRKMAEDPDVWELIEKLRYERDRYRNDAYRYERAYKRKKKLEVKKRKELRRKALLSRYLYHLRRRELYLLYMEVVGRELKTKP